MNIISRGIRNAFRNVIRTVSIVVILGLSIGLSLVMLIANHAVANKIESVKRSVGNIVTIRPAGFMGSSKTNNALTASQLDKVRKLAHVTKRVESLQGHAMTAGASVPAGAVISINGSTEGTTTSLKSPIKINTKGEGGGVVINSDGGPPPSDFTPPISILGTTNPTGTIAELNASITLKSGQAIDGNKDADTALISTAMAEKNSLKVGSTFEAYKKTLTVAGIFESGTEAGDNFVIMSLPTLQRLSGNTGVVTEAVATVDSVTNIASTTAAVKKTIGSSNADVTSSEETVKNAIKPLQSIQSVSLYSLIGAVAAGGVIILLTMIMIVRERKREIGVIKAIGSSNQRIMLQFMAEALTLTVLGAVVGLMIGVAAGGPVTQTLVDNTANSTNGGGGPVTSAGPGSGTFHTFGGGPGSAIQGIRDVQAQIGWTIILDGLGAAILIALIGSALASFFIAKVKPAEVLRSE